jgi:nucleoside-diphosphate-sugar epimerase
MKTLIVVAALVAAGCSVNAALAAPAAADSGAAAGTGFPGDPGRPFNGMPLPPGPLPPRPPARPLPKGPSIELAVEAAKAIVDACKGYHVSVHGGDACRTENQVRQEIKTVCDHLDAALFAAPVGHPCLELRQAVFAALKRHVTQRQILIHPDRVAHCGIGGIHHDVRRLPGSIADTAVVARAFDAPIDLVFHLASIPGGMAEQNFELGRQINLNATLDLLQAARAQTINGLKPATFVFASSIAVLGAPLPARVDDATPLRPKLSYGAHKLIGEVLAEDFHRRGWVKARSVRLPGIVARPPQRTGQLSAFMSDIIRDLAEGRAFACPVAANSTTWLMSVRCVVDNLLHAAVMPESSCAETRVWTLPALHSSMTQLVAAIAEVHGSDVLTRVTFGSNAELEANFGRYPPLRTPAADAAGFAHDGDLPSLVRHALLPVTHV